MQRIMKRSGHNRTDTTARRCAGTRDLWILRSAIAFCVLSVPVSAFCQSPYPAPAGATATQAQSGLQSGSLLGGDDRQEDGAAAQSGSLTTQGLAVPTTLSSSQIIRILQENPELIVELKSQVADRMREQGAQIDANDISDEMLYAQIASSAELRTSIASFLRARGYTSDDDLSGGQSIGSRSVDDLGDLPREQGSDGLRSSIAASQLGMDGTAAGLLSAQGTGSSSQSARLPAGRSNRQVQNPRAHEDVSASTDAPKVLRLPAPYNLQSMRDLYTQIPDRVAPLKRFGADVFVTRDSGYLPRDGASHDMPLDVPLGPDYVVGAGDVLTINLWGGLTQSFPRVIDRDGRIFLPDAGSVQVGGLSLQKAQGVIESALKQQYRDVRVAVTVSRVRSVRVYVVGDVQRPGGYDISSLATPLSALYAAGGPTAAGSLRIVQHYRGKQLVEQVDLYDFLLHGLRNGTARFESGDTVLVPPAGPQVAIYGAVKRPAIYELPGNESSLATVIDDAGGLTAAASSSHITIERIDGDRERETVTVKTSGDGDASADHAAAVAFRVRDGDRVHIAPILPYSQRAIYLEGHVVRPGRMPYTDGMKLTDVLHSYQDMLPEPASHGEIVRLVPPDFHAETIDFDVPDAVLGDTNINLQPFDTIRIFGRYEIDAPKVMISGEVLRPGFYPMSRGMTAGQLVRMAGGFKRDALLDSADLTSYSVVNGNRIIESLASINIGAAVEDRDAKDDIVLKPGDSLTIHQVTGWNDIGESVTIAGQVRFPGNYGFKDGERLSSVLRRAGGLLPTAYPLGAVLEREQVRELEQKSREELIRQIETNSAAARLSPNLGAQDNGATMQLIKAQQDEALEQLKSHPPSGRMVIHINSDIDSWANTDVDIELRRGDVLTIPKRPGFVLVTGQVYNATALTFTPGKTAAWYLSHAGGTNTTANHKEIFIIRSNGSVVGRRSGGLFEPDVLSTKLDPGDVVVVPQKVIGSSLVWRNLLTAAQLASSIAITAAVAAL
jgi:protein involved in polysaccharide export with SLBB domain